jgi:quinol monooxygenase YgiN
MPTDRIHVIATLRAAPGRQARLREVLEGLLPPTRAEPGCLRYLLVQPEGDPDTFVFLEEWEGPEALDAHFKTPHFQAAAGSLDGLVTAPPDIRRYRSA